MLARLAMLCVLLLSPSPLFAQSSAPAQPAEPLPPPAIRRWLDVEQLRLSSRFRWVEASDGTLTSSALQWQPQLRARLPIDPGGRYAVQVGAFSGASFVSGWNNTGGGVGDYAGVFNVKQLFLAAEVLPGLHLSAGGLYLTRGQSTEITSYDTDGYIVGERVQWHPDEGPVSQIAMTAGYLGDLREPNVFNRFRRLDTWNYEQFLIGWRLGPHVTASTDYTHEGDRDTLREAMTVRLPQRVKVITALKLDLYERLSPDTAHGLNVSADLRPFPRLAVTAGFTSIDRDYGGLNADRYDRGNRVYSMGTYMLTDVLSIGWFATEAMANDEAVVNEHRFDIVMTFDPTAALKRRRIF